MSFIHLHVHSNFSFKDSTLAIHDIIRAATHYEMPAVALTDHNNLCGAVRFYYVAQKAGVKPIIGVEIDTAEGHLTLLAMNAEGYTELCRLISKAQLYGKGICNIKDITHCKNVIILSGCDRGVLYRAYINGSAEKTIKQHKEIFSDRYYIELQHHKLPEDNRKIYVLSSLATRLDIPIVATNNVHFLKPSDYHVRDILVAMAENTHVDGKKQSGLLNSEYSFKSTNAMKSLFADLPAAIINTVAIAERCNIVLPNQRRFPKFSLPEGRLSAKDYLKELCLAGISRLYGITPPAQVLQRLEYELSIIDTMGFNDYFLIVWDIVTYAKQNGIRCAGRGSAADSLVSYLLGITHVDPIAHKLLFERFLNPERRGMPDIDIDFDSNRRDEVINYVYNKYGSGMAAMVCTINTMGARSAVWEVGKALGLSTAEQSAISKRLPRWGSDDIETALNVLPELKDELQDDRSRTIFRYAERFADFPRHLGVHNGGVIIADQSLTELTPLQYASKGVIISQYDKDDVEKLGLVKMDLLGLKILSIITDTVTMLQDRGIILDIDDIPKDDAGTYELLRSTRTIGVFQLESPGMRELLGRLQPTEFEDIIANISLFRPGPMQGDMIAPYIERRHGRANVEYMHPLLETVLRDTYGVIVYQEQVLEIAHVLAGFTLGQADLLRRAMTKDRSPEDMAAIRQQFLSGCKSNGVEESISQKVFEKLAGFAAYGFNKAHAASFGWLAYQTAYLKAHYPAEFLCATLNNYPCGFYPPMVIAWETKRLGIPVVPPHAWGKYDCYIEHGSIRLGKKYIQQSTRTDNSSTMLKSRTANTIHDEIELVGFPVTLHPVEVLPVKHTTSRQVEVMPHGATVTVAGIIITRQTPPTRSGKRIIFLTLHDATGLIDVTVFPDIQQQYAKIVYRSSIIEIFGTVRKTGKAGFSIIAQKIKGLV